MEMKIGPDELILWLRKNGKAEGFDNAALGRKIIKLIQGLDGEPKEGDYPSLWVNDLSPVAADRLRIPMSSQQYIIDTKKLPEIFEEISNW
jgi:hypothetical protein